MRAEPVGVAGLGVVGVKPLRQQPEHALDRIRVRVRADLQHFVEVDRTGLRT